MIAAASSYETASRHAEHGMFTLPFRRQGFLAENGQVFACRLLRGLQQEPDWASRGLAQQGNRDDGADDDPAATMTQGMSLRSRGVMAISLPFAS